VADVLDASSQAIDTDFASQPEVASALHAFIGRGYKDLGLYPNAMAQLEPAIKMRRNLNLPASNETAQMLEDLAASYYWEEQYDKALPIYEEALAMRKDVWGPVHEDVASTLNHLAACKDAMREREAAETLYRQALEMREQILGANHLDTVATMNNLATCLRGQGELEESQQISRQALAKLRGQNPPNDAAIAATLTGLATTLMRLPEGAGRPEAIRLLTEALQLKRQELGNDHPMLTTTLQRLADATLANNDAASAESLYRESLQIREARLQPDHLWIAESQLGLGRCLTTLKKYPEAEELLGKAQAMYTSANDNRSLRVIQAFISLYAAWGKPERVAEFNAKLAQDSPTPQGTQSP
jgi:tetratricopeptide (TPR) repeat protein